MVFAAGLADGTGTAVEPAVRRPGIDTWPRNIVNNLRRKREYKAL
jgi:hypothetical protein